MRSVKLGCEFAIRFQRAGQRLLQQHAMSRLDQRAGVLLMIFRGSDDNARVADIGASQLLHGRKYWRLQAVFSGESSWAIGITIDQSRDRATTLGCKLQRV